MARCVKPDRDHLIKIRTDSARCVYVRLVPGGRRAYLHISGENDHAYHSSISGPKTLRALAKAILNEVPE